MKSQHWQKYRYHNWLLLSQVNLKFNDCKTISIRRQINFSLYFCTCMHPIRTLKEKRDYIKNVTH
jgi:hypothetical protein